MRKTLAMRLTAIVILTATLHCTAAGYTQNNITLKETNAPLEKLLLSIRKQSGYAIVYTKQMLQQSTLVTVDLQKVSLTEALDACLSKQPLEYTIVNKTIVLKAKATALKTQPDPPGEVTGRVINEQGEPLAGASVIIKRTGKGDIADANGNFKLKNANADDVVEISFTGYKTNTFKIGGASVLALTLNVAVDELDRAVVQAYGKTTQRLATGNIAKVTAQEIERQPVMNPLLALQGKVAGLNVTQTNGFASAPIKVELRGRSIIGVTSNETFPSDPLFIVDGVPLTILEIGGSSNYTTGSRGFLQSFGFNGPAAGQSPFFNLNPSDIESIEVLKDADATAIYGSRGANGVILITTKKGKSVKTAFDIRIQKGITKVVRYWDMADTKGYLQMRREALGNDNIIPSIDHGDYDLLLWDTNQNTDWQKILYGGVGKTTDVQSSISGGNSQTNFRIGAGFNSTTNITTISGKDEKGSLSFNMNNNSKDHRFSIALSGMYSITKSDMINLPAAAMLPPNAPSIYDSAGNLNYAGWGSLSSSARSRFPFALLKQPYTSKTNFLNSNLTIGFTPLKGIRISTSAGYNNAQANQEELRLIASMDPSTNPKGSAKWAFNFNKNWIIEPQATFEKLIWKGKVNVLVGGTFQENKTDGLYTEGSGYTSDDLIRTITNAPSQGTGEKFGMYKYSAFFGRLSYNLVNKYLLNLNARRDGSSRFGEDKQYGNFGSASVAWIFTEEKWIKNHLSFLSFGKIRASYGITGTDAIGDYKYLTRWSSENTRPYGSVTTLIPIQHANPDFQWQVNKKLEVGIELGLMKDKITLSFSNYKNRCGNQLVLLPTPLMTGFSTVAANSAALVQNSGFEFVFNAKLVEQKDFAMNVNFNGAFNRNKLIDYPNLDKSPFASTLIVGEPLNIVQRFKFIGVDPQTGEYLVEDKIKDGTIAYEPGKLTSDTYVYDLSPKFIGGAGLNINYKTVELNLFFTIKKQIGKNALPFDAGIAQNVPDEILGKQWNNVGDNSTYGRFTTSGLSSGFHYGFSDAYFTDASFIRLSNLSLSYKLPFRLSKEAKSEGLTLFIHANNLFLITNYKGLDPDTQNFGGLPPTRTVVGGLNLNF